MSELPTIPTPPAECMEPHPPRFEPGHELPAWVQDVFVSETSDLHNPDHVHLEHAHIGFLWTNIDKHKKGRRVLGEARVGEPAGSDAWAKGRQRQQIEGWFGRVPDFLITLHGPYVASCLKEDNGVAALALVEHELYHCAQKMRDGIPQFDPKTGRPKWDIRGHDIEEFVGVVERYGAARPSLERMRQAFEAGPTVEEAAIQGVCACGAALA